MKSFLNRRRGENLSTIIPVFREIIVKRSVSNDELRDIEKILIVYDSDDQRHVATDLPEVLGYHMGSVANGQATIAKIVKKNDVIGEAK